VYVTDNGWIQTPTANPYAPRSKRSPNEGGIRTPIMLRWPAKLKPIRDDATLVSTIDLAPTILAACDLPPTKEMRGINLLEFAPRKKPSGDTILGEIYGQDVIDIDRFEPNVLQGWCIWGEWKLIEMPDGSKRELYHITADPTEEKNLAAEL